METIKTAQPLIPEWRLEDYGTDMPYEWLYERSKTETKFMFLLLFDKALKAAGSIGVPATLFRKMWKTYVESNSPEVTILGANTTAFPEQETALEGIQELQCGEYICGEDGVNRRGQMGEDIQVISHPIMPVKRIMNIDSGEEQLLIAYRRGRNDAKWQTMVTRNETIASAQKVISLANFGIAVNSENAKEVVRYMSDIVSRNYDELPLQRSTSHLGWLKSGGFVPYEDGIEYDGSNPSGQRMFGAFTPTGSRDVWMRIALEARAGESLACRIALAGAFVAPLISKFNALSFILHFYGESGMGKTVGLMMSASVWADPSVGDTYIQNFQGTKVALESTAAICCNVPVYIDESQHVKELKTLDDLIYMLCQGSSKPRGTKDGGLQLKKHWETCILTTGESPLLKANSGGGAQARTIEVDYGNRPFFKDSRAVAETLKQNYGHIGREYIEILRREGVMEELREIQDKYYKELAKHDIHAKQILSASILLAADAIATRELFRDGKALTVDDILPYLVTNKQADVNYRCYQWLMGFIASNPRRFEVVDNNGELWGERKDGVVYFIRTVFDRVLTDNGFSSTTFLNWAKVHDKIKYESYGEGRGNNRLTKRKNINGHATTCIALVMDESEMGSEMGSLKEETSHSENVQNDSQKRSGEWSKRTNDILDPDYLPF